MKRTTTMRPRIATLLLSLAVCIWPLELLPYSLCDDEQMAITKISGDQIKEIGQEADFNCTLHNPKNYSVLWMKIDKDRVEKNMLALQTTLIFNGNDKFVVNYHNASTTYALKIKNLSESDTGFYVCEISNTIDNKVSREMRLQIRRPPSISKNMTKIANATEGETFELYCTADGYPPPRILWKRENDEILSFGGTVYRNDTLIIEKSHRDDRGVYICVAENDVGPRDQANATVYIRFSPIVTAVKPRVGQSRGYGATLECMIEAYPPPVVYWYKNTTQLGKNDFTSKESQNHEYHGTYSLTAGDDTYGVYSCKAVNALGESTTKIELIESIVPVCPPAC